MTEFPKAKYKKGEQPKQVNDSDEEKALGKGWFNTPGEAEDEKEVKQQVPAQPKA